METITIETIAGIIGLSIFATWLLLLLVIVAFIAVYVIGNVKLFKRCNQEGWKAIIPFYSDYVFLVKICKLHWGWCLGYLIISLFSLNNGVYRLFSMFVSGIAFYNLAIKVNKENITALIFGALFSPIMKIIYGFSNINYSDIETKPSGLF